MATADRPISARLIPWTAVEWGVAISAGNGVRNAYPVGSLERAAAAARAIMRNASIATCATCDDTQWVCEDHPSKPWGERSGRRDFCRCGGAGAPCPVCNGG